MDSKILMNKNTLAALKVELKEYQEALPIFEMKEQQLVGVVRNLEQDIVRLDEAIEETNEKIKSWVGVFAEPCLTLSDVVHVENVITETKEIVGVEIESFVEIKFKDIAVNLLTTPLWIDAAIEVLKDQITNKTIIKLKKKAIVILEEELSEARRMKNALKEVFIPETKENIRKIEIYLGDVERLAIGCAKLVKKKKVEKVAAL